MHVSNISPEMGEEKTLPLGLFSMFFLPATDGSHESFVVEVYVQSLKGFLSLYRFLKKRLGDLLCESSFLPATIKFPNFSV